MFPLLDLLLSLPFEILESMPASHSPKRDCTRIGVVVNVALRGLRGGAVLAIRGVCDSFFRRIGWRPPWGELPLRDRGIGCGAALDSIPSGGD
jgi:hypothetical protein